VRLLVRLLVTAVAVALVWVVLVTALMWRYQERVVFQPPPDNPDAPRPARRVEYMASDGGRSFGYLVAPAAGAREPATVVIAFHGNADLAAWQVPWALEVAERTGAAVLLPEYRGYAGAPGPPTYATAAADARGALDFARSSFRSAGIVLYGHSLGSAIAAELAAEMREQPPKALILVSPFTSARDMATRMLVPPIPGLWRLISRVQYDTRARVSRLESPVFVSHGDRDLTIPVRMGRKVYAAAQNPEGLLVVEGAGHNDVAEVAGDRYWSWLCAAVGAPAATTSCR
jgi:fermentation-respiration switch protein FrsA (DUF1100 family)